MTTAFTPAGMAGSATALPTLPQGWPIASYDTYAQAQQAVDHLADSDFPVQGVTIVGVEPMVVERVAARLTWKRVLGMGAATGAWFGLFVGLLLSLFAPGAGLAPILLGLLIGVGFGMASGAARYAATRGQRDFISHSQLVARRYDVLCPPNTAERGRELVASLAMSTQFTH